MPATAVNSCPARRLVCRIRALMVCVAALSCTLAVCPDLAAAADPNRVACPRTLLLHNQHEADVVLEVGDSGPRWLGAGQTARHCAPTPTVQWTVRASMAAAAWQWRGHAVLAEGERRTVSIDAPMGYVTVTNHSGEPQRISVDGTVLGDVAAGRQLSVGPIPSGVRKVVAASQRRAAFWGTTLTVAAGRTASLSLPRPDALLELHNPFDEIAALEVDGQPLGAVAASARVDVAAMALGRHAVRWIGVDSGTERRQDVEAATGQGAQSAEVTIVVENLSGEAVEVPAVLHPWATTLAPGQKAQWRLPRGEYGVRFVGGQSGLVYRFDVLRKGPERLTWNLKRPTAVLRLVNRSSERVEVDVPVLGPLPIPAGRRAVLRVPAGRMALVARAAGRAEPYKAGLMLQGGDEATWEIRARATYTVCVNRWHEPIDLYVDGLLARRVAAGGELRVPLVEGSHTLEARVPRLGWGERVTLQVRDGDALQTVWMPPDAAMRIDNSDGGEPLQLWAGGVRMATVEPATVSVAPIASARHTVTVEGVRSGRRLAVEPLLAPAQTTDLPHLPWASVRVMLRATDGPLQVRLDGGEAVTVDASGTALGTVTPGRHVLRLLQGGRDWRVAFTVDGQQAEVGLTLRRSGP